MKSYLIILTFIFTFFTSVGQIQLWLNDGTILSTSNYRIDSSKGYVFYLDKKQKTKVLDHQAIFAIIDKQDTLVLNKPENLTLSQAFSFLQGVNDGYHYKNKAIFFSNMGLGLTAGIAMPILGLSGIYSVIPNLASTIIFSSTNVKNLKTSSNDSLYTRGYQISSRKKRLLIATGGSLIGLTTGSIIGYLIKK